MTTKKLFFQTQSGPLRFLINGDYGRYLCSLVQPGIRGGLNPIGLARTLQDALALCEDSVALGDVDDMAIEA